MLMLACQDPCLFSESCARASQASAISSNACRSFPVIWFAMRIQSAAYVLNFSESRNLASSVPATRTPVFGALFLNNIVMRKDAEPMDPHLTFTTAWREGWLPFFSAVDYRRYAAECVRLAQQVADSDDKARLLDMAETFRELADKSDIRHAYLKAEGAKSGHANVAALPATCACKMLGSRC